MASVSDGPVKKRKASGTLSFQAPVVLITIIANRLTASGTMMFGDRHGLGSTGWKVLACIAARPGVSGLGISQLVGLDRGAVSRVLKDFGKRKLIQVEKSDRHSNYQEVSLTPEGQSIHDDALETALQREKLFLDGFSRDEKAQLVDFLNRLLENARDIADFARADRSET